MLGEKLGSVNPFFEESPCWEVSVTKHRSAHVFGRSRETPMLPAYETRRFAPEEHQIAMAPFQDPFQNPRLPGLF
jgi:hypothetical protein